jgi:hypothetical protein
MGMGDGEKCLVNDLLNNYGDRKYAGNLKKDECGVIIVYQFTRG